MINNTFNVSELFNLVAPKEKSIRQANKEQAHLVTFTDEDVKKWQSSLNEAAVKTLLLQVVANKILFVARANARFSTLYKVDENGKNTAKCNPYSIQLLVKSETSKKPFQIALITKNKQGQAIKWINTHSDELRQEVITLTGLPNGTTGEFIEIL